MPNVIGEQTQTLAGFEFRVVETHEQTTYDLNAGVATGMVQSRLFLTELLSDGTSTKSIVAVGKGVGKEEIVGQNPDDVVERVRDWQEAITLDQKLSVGLEEATKFNDSELQSAYQGVRKLVRKVIRSAVVTGAGVATSATGIYELNKTSSSPNWVIPTLVGVVLASVGIADIMDETKLIKGDVEVNGHNSISDRVARQYVLAQASTALKTKIATEAKAEALVSSPST
jgi:hypothetical protein